jgi:hypothetical protein
MLRSLLALIPVLVTGEVTVKDRTFTIRGNGYLDPTGPGLRVPVTEARVTLRENRDFAATLFARGERILVRGTWDPRGSSAIERIDINDAFGTRAEGSGSIHFNGRGGNPVRFSLEGRTRQGPFRVEIRDRDDEWNDRRDDPRRNDGDDRRAVELGNGDRVHRNIDATTDGNGLLRMAGVRNGNFSVSRVRLGTSRDATIDIDRGTRGTIRGQITDVRGARVAIRVTNMLGNRATGEIIAVMRGTHEIERLNGSGRSDAGSWQMDFESTERSARPPGGGREDWDRRPGEMEAAVSGSGSLTQDIGPSLSFDRLRVRLQPNHDAVVTLQGRRQTISLVGRWSAGRMDDLVTIELGRVNEKRADGRLNLRMNSRAVEALDGAGRTDMGRFRVAFDRR